MMERVALSAGRCGSECVEYSIKVVFESQEQCVEFGKLFKEFSYIQTYSFEENGYFDGLIIYKK